MPVHDLLPLNAALFFVPSLLLVFFEKGLLLGNTVDRLVLLAGVSHGLRIVV